MTSRYSAGQIFKTKGLIMGIIEIVLTAIGLSMDALAVSICKGLCMKSFKAKTAALIALFFGFFQALMPFIGWLLGISFQKYIEAYDHWIAFVLLAIIGGKMIAETLKEQDDDGKACDTNIVSIKELTVLAIATSIDALAVGIAMACLGNSINIFSSITIIGLITLFICFAGVYIGFKFGSKFEKNAGFAGGTILILIGIKILLEHLGILDKFFTWISTLF